MVKIIDAIVRAILAIGFFSTPIVLQLIDPDLNSATAGLSFIPTGMVVGYYFGRNGAAKQINNSSDS